MENQFYQTEESVAEYIAAAKDVNGRRLIEKLKKHLPQGSLLLEIGSGPGSDFEILKEVYRSVGSDFSTEFIRLLKLRFPQDEFLNLNAVSLDTTRKFQGLYSNKVLHHLHEKELKESILRQADLLESDGVICHSFWKGEGNENFKGLHVSYYSAENLSLLFQDHFKIITLEEYDEFETGDSLVLIAKKKDHS